MRAFCVKTAQKGPLGRVDCAARDRRRHEDGHSPSSDSSASGCFFLRPESARINGQVCDKKRRRPAADG